MILGQCIRFDLNNVQRSWFVRCAGTARFAFNWGLARWQAQYKAGGKPFWQGLNKELNAIKAVEFPWMAELPWAITNKALADLGGAFTNFFRRVKQGGKPGYPRFKKKGHCQGGFAIEGRALQFDGKRVKVPKLGWVRTQQKLRFSGKILSARFSERAGHWYLSIQVDVTDSWTYPHRCETQAAVGVDLGIHDLAVLSTGEKIEAPRSFRRYEARLRMLNKKLSRRKKGSRNRGKTKRKLARLHKHIANIRRDIIHKLTARLVGDFRLIGVENLNIAGMKQGLRLGKSVSDAAMAEVLRQIDYKSVLSGSVVVKADRWFPSTKTCSDCGVVNALVVLGVERWTCPNCGTPHDRDINAAINLRNMALAQRVTACRQGSSGPSRKIRTKLPLGQEFGSVVNFC